MPLGGEEQMAIWLDGSSNPVGKDLVYTVWRSTGQQVGRLRGKLLYNFTISYFNNNNSNYYDNV